MKIELDLDDILKALKELSLGKDEQEKILEVAVNLENISWDETTQSIVNVVRETYDEYDFNTLLEGLGDIDYKGVSERIEL